MDPFYKAHWRKVDDARMAGYRTGFQWSDASEDMYAPAAIADGQKIADFGCGPGHVAVELARRVGPTGHVYALDINSEFLEQVQQNALAAEVEDRITTHLSDGAHLEFDDNELDRITARNTLMYVDDAETTLREFRRVLCDGGKAHAIDGDWFMMVVEPLDHDLWRSFVKAAAYACRHADMGRRLYGSFRQAGFDDIDVRIVCNPDTTGRLVGMVRNMANYARQGGGLADRDIKDVLQGVDAALADGSYFAVSPQFVVTGTRHA